MSPEVLRNAKNGDKNSINHIIKACEPLIFSVAKTFYNINNHDDELYQEGRLAVLAAINNFDETKKIKFTTYARRAIRNRMLNFIKSSWKIPALALHINDNDSSLPSPEEHVLSYEKVALKLEEFKSNLSDLESKIFALRIEGYSYIEIARLLKQTSKSVDNALTRIKTKILKQEEENGLSSII